VPGRVARSLEDLKVTCGVAVPERPAHFMAGTANVVRHSHDKARWLGADGQEGAGLHRGPITSATPEGDATLAAQRVTGTLMVGMGVCENVSPQWVSRELTEESPTCKPRPGIDKHVTNDIDVEIVERQQRETKDTRSDVAERHGL